MEGAGARSARESMSLVSREDGEGGGKLEPGRGLRGRETGCCCWRLSEKAFVREEREDKRVGLVGGGSEGGVSSARLLAVEVRVRRADARDGILRRHWQQFEGAGRRRCNRVFIVGIGAEMGVWRRLS